MIGRDIELAAVEALLGAGGGSRALVLEGEAGIGKTTIWASGVERARGRGATVLVSRPAQVEAGLSFAGLADLIGSVPAAVRSRLPEPQQVSLAAALLEAPAPPQGLDEAALCAAVLSVLRLLGAQAPGVVVAVDDTQWLDPPSARALAFAARRLQVESVAFLLTHRIGSGRAGSGQLGEGIVAPGQLGSGQLGSGQLGSGQLGSGQLGSGQLGSGQLGSGQLGSGQLGLDATASLLGALEVRRQVIEVGPMTPAALHELILRRTGASLARPTLVHVARLSGGNPLFALEIAAGLEGRPPQGGNIPVPASVSSLFGARMARLPASTRKALLVSACLAQPSTELVDRRTLAPAVDEGIVVVEGQRVRFSHPLMASAAYAMADPAARRRVHRALAARVGEPEEQARQLALSVAGPDEQVAGRLASAAALVAARGAPAAAAELVELALGLTPQPETKARNERMLAASRLWSDAGDLQRAQAILEELLAGAPAGEQGARALQLLGQLHGRRSSIAEAFALGSQALGQAGGDESLRADTELDLAFYSASLGDFEQAAEHGLGAAAAAESAGSNELLAAALAVVTVAAFLGGHGLDEKRLTRALELEDPNESVAFVMRPSFINGNILLWLGHPRQALAVHDRVLKSVRDRGEEAAVPLLTIYAVWSCLWVGDFDRAARLATEAKSTAVLLGDAAANAVALAASALVHAHCGSAELARSEGTSALAIFEDLHWQAGSIWPLWALGLAELGAGDPAAVDAALGALSEVVTSRMGDVALGVFVPDEIEALVELGELGRAEHLTCWIECRAQELDRRWALALAGRCRGLLHAARRDPGAAIEALEGALELHCGLDLPFERARTLLLLGRIQRRAAKRAQARRTMDEALGIFESLGASLWANRARAEMARLNTRSPGLDVLSSTEAQIASLAAAGLSNREIGDRAFLSVKAVESNLTRVYRKLAIRSRSQLARRLGSQLPR